MKAGQPLQSPTRLIAPSGGGARWAPYSREVQAATSRDREPNVFIFVGRDAWRRAERRRLHFGQGTALVLPPDAAPESLRWPALRAVVVAWPEATQEAFLLKLRLAQALVRDGTRYAAIEHAPDWINAWREGAQPR